jgi:D-alanyl-D-alanine carboxypeptidase (penicillin-binding protein 5/6)
MVVARKLLAACLAGAVLAACSGGDDDTLPAPTDAGGGTLTVASGDDGGTGTGTLVDAGTAATTSAPTTVAPTTIVPPTTVAPTPPPTPPPTTAPAPPPAPPTTVVPTIEAAAWAVYDMRLGGFLPAANNADAQLPVGSVIKLLTAQAAYAAGNPVKVVTAPAGLLIDPEESRIGINEGQELPRDLLVRAMLIVSANDAARLLALDIAGGEAQFAELMNQQAANLGLANTHAVNVTGLDADGQFSSANDLARLSAFLMGNPTFQLTVARTEAQLNGQSIPSTNDLLETYPGADGIKTGRTTNAGWCIVASAMRDGRRMIAVVLGAPTEEARDAGATALLDWAFTQPYP